MPATKGRPKQVNETDVVAITGETAGGLLQPQSERRAVILKLVDYGGRATIGELNVAFGYSVTKVIGSLKRVGWVKIIPAKKAPKLPRRPETLTG